MRKSVLHAVVFVMMLAVMFFTVSCAKKQVAQTQPVPAIKPEITKASDRSADEADQARRAQEDRLRAEAAAREAARTTFVKENVHFAFDSYVLSDRARLILEGKASYLRANSQLTVTVEGHCDERGTDAYNLALGQRRAESTKNFLVYLGINADRLNTISYGEERPIAAGHSEESWAENRRAQFVIK